MQGQYHNFSIFLSYAQIQCNRSLLAWQTLHGKHLFYHYAHIYPNHPFPFPAGVIPNPVSSQCKN